VLSVGVGAVGFVTVVLAERGPVGSESMGGFLGKSVTAGGFGAFSTGREVGPEMELLGEASAKAGDLRVGRG